MSQSKNVEKPRENLKNKLSKKPVKRIIRGEQDIHHDLYRLELAVTVKNISFSAKPKWEDIPHKHFFHNINSDGKPQDKSCPTANHFHYIVVDSSNGELSAECSEPYTMGIVDGKKKAIPYKNDKHVHDVTYLQSEVMKQRVMNDDALKEISRIQNRNAQRMQNPAL